MRGESALFCLRSCNNGKGMILHMTGRQALGGWSAGVYSWRYATANGSHLTVIGIASRMKIPNAPT